MFNRCSVGNAPLVYEASGALVFEVRRTQAGPICASCTPASTRLGRTQLPAACLRVSSQLHTAGCDGRRMAPRLVATPSSCTCTYMHARAHTCAHAHTHTCRFFQGAVLCAALIGVRPALPLDLGKLQLCDVQRQRARASDGWLPAARWPLRINGCAQRGVGGCVVGACSGRHAWVMRCFAVHCPDRGGSPHCKACTTLACRRPQALSPPHKPAHLRAGCQREARRRRRRQSSQRPCSHSSPSAL